MILSFHPIFEADENRLCAGRDPDANDLAAIKCAHAVILPQGCSRGLFEMVRENCDHVFPNYDLRFQYPGKAGQIKLFEAYAIDHPATIVVKLFKGINTATLDLSAIGYPLVLKRDWGGEGFTVYWIDDQAKLEIILKRILDESAESEKVLLQKVVPDNQGRVMRVVCIGSYFKAYWRMSSSPEEGIVHLAEDGHTDTGRADPELLPEAERAAQRFCAKTRINLVGIDYLFDSSTPTPRPLIIELNYFFGRKGLGGSQAYYTILTREIQKWCQRTLG